MKVHKDISKDWFGHTVSGAHIVAGNINTKLKLKYADHCSIFRSELIAMYSKIHYYHCTKIH